jgi:membrane associated rhomboid family serine protease
VIPLYDDQPTRTFPLVTVLLIAANVLMYAAEQIVPGFTNTLEMVPYRVTHPLDVTPYLVQITSMGDIVRAVPPNVGTILLHQNEIFVPAGLHPSWETIFSAMFLHANLLHIGGNMLYLWIFGNNVEDALGKVRFTLFYFICGTVAAYAQIYTDPNSLIPTLGASGAIAGVLGAYWFLYPDARVLTILPLPIFFLWPIRAYWVLGFWIVLQVGEGLTGLGMERGGGVAYFAHIGGFIAGLILIRVLGGRALTRRQRRSV